MANKYPYVASAGPLVKTIDHLRRRTFPAEVTADTLRKLGVAPKNESYVINVLRFLGVVDGEGKKIPTNTNAFVQHKDEEFENEFEKLVRDAYEELFELHGDAAWNMDRTSLAQFFRTSDHSSEIVGTRQASTFTALAALAGHREVLQGREVASREPVIRKGRKATTRKSSAEQRGAAATTKTADNSSEARIGLTVRIEVNLPAEGDQQTYDRIFRSIRKNLLNGD